MGIFFLLFFRNIVVRLYHSRSRKSLNITRNFWPSDYEDEDSEEDSDEEDSEEGEKGKKNVC